MISMPTVELRKITATNWDDVLSLRVDPAQEKFVDGVADSLAEAASTPYAMPWYRAVYDGETPVGFVMISDNVEPGHEDCLGPYYLWRLLVDARFQGRGFGSAALDEVVAYVRQRPGAEILLTSTTPGEGNPTSFYLRYGFRLTGEVFDGEAVLELDLSSVTEVTSASRNDPVPLCVCNGVIM